MKHLFIALLCTVIGFSASASDLTPKKKDAPTGIKTELKTDLKKKIKNTDVKVSVNKDETLGLYRRQMAFLFHDMCGNAMVVYASGGHSVSVGEMYGFCHDYVEAHTGANGCFN
jgi:hypothetical protein